MQKEIIASFIQGASEVIYEVSGKKPEAGQVKLYKGSIPSEGLAVIMGITGTLQGRVILDLSLPSAHKFASTILQEEIDEKESELIESCMGELANMITGRAVSMLNEMGHSIKVTPPTIFKGKELKITDKTPQMLIVPLSTELGNISLNLSFV